MLESARRTAPETLPAASTASHEEVVDGHPARGHLGRHGLSTEFWKQEVWRAFDEAPLTRVLGSGVGGFLAP